MTIPKRRKIKKQYLKILFFLAIAVIILIIIVVIFSRKNSKNGNKKENVLENKMTELVTSFYDEKIKGMVIGINRQIVTLEDLKDNSYDISDFTKAKCKMESFSYVILKDAKETDINKIQYTIEHHLDCTQ